VVNLFVDWYSCGACFQVQATFFGHIPDSVALAKYNTKLRLLRKISIYFSPNS
jgi:hypothetical protein